MPASALLLLVAKVTVVLGGAACAAHLLRRASAAARHAVWTAGLAASLALPLAGLVVPAARISAPGRLWSAVEGWLGSFRAPAAPVAPAAETRRPHAITPSLDGDAVPAAVPTRAPVRTGELLFALWALGAAVCLARVVLGVVAADRIARRARPVQDGALATIARELAAAGLGPRSVRLLESAEVSAPAAVGILRPAVLLPPEASEWGAAEARAVLAHELGHVARRDCLTQLVAGIATAVYWFHPLAWYAAGRMVVERERACDDRALLAGAHPSRYASLLVDVLRAARGSVYPAAVLPMAALGEIETRIRSILDPAVRRRRLSTRARIAMPLATAAAAALVAAVRVDAAPAPMAPSAAAALVAAARGDAAPASSSAAALASSRAVWTDTTRREPDTRGDSMSRPSSERIPLDASVFDQAVRNGRAALGGSDATLAHALLMGLERAPTWPGDLVRERSAWALAQAEGTSLVEPLLAALSSRDWREQAYAVWALAQSRDPRAVAPLIELLGRPEWRLRAMAASALDELGDPRALPAMARAAGDEAWQVRVSAVAFLGRVGGDANQAIVRAHLADRHIAVRLAAEKALGGER
ncbi:MAG: M56 family metallopeptidase [Longimicrobiaceae bacterium]